MKFEKLSKNKNQKRIIILSIIGIILLIGGITFYRTFALYEEKKEFNVLKGKIVAGKTKVVAKIDGVETTMPEKEVLFMENLSCTNGIKSSWDYKSWKITTEESLKNSTCTISFLSPKNFAEYIEYKRYQDDSIEEFSHSATYQTPDLTDYRYTGANPDNYVCFGSEASPCPSDNLYRIIGVIPTQSEENSIYENRVKLIKASKYEGPNAISGSIYTDTGKGYYYNGWNNSNQWGNTLLNSEINYDFWNSLGNYQQYIEKSKWYLGAPNYRYNQTYTSNNLYDIERSNTKGYSQGPLFYLNNIGLMYLSDFGYSLGSGYRAKSIYANGSLYMKYSWLGNKEPEWTISPEAARFDSYQQVSAWITYVGVIQANYISFYDHIFVVRPTFYLKSSVQYKSGTGSKENPYHIS